MDFNDTDFNFALIKIVAISSCGLYFPFLSVVRLNVVRKEGYKFSKQLLCRSHVFASGH